VKSFLSSLLFFSVTEYRFQERCVLLVGNAVITKQVVIDENQIQTADDKCCYAIVRLVFFSLMSALETTFSVSVNNRCVVCSIRSRNFGLLFNAANICARSMPRARKYSELGIGKLLSRSSTLNSPRGASSRKRMGKHLFPVVNALVVHVAKHYRKQTVAVFEVFVNE
jgi:hypothetical protein